MNRNFSPDSNTNPHEEGRGKTPSLPVLPLATTWEALSPNLPTAPDNAFVKELCHMTVRNFQIKKMIDPHLCAIANCFAQELKVRAEGLLGDPPSDDDVHLAYRYAGQISQRGLEGDDFATRPRTFGITAQNTVACFYRGKDYSIAKESAQKYLANPLMSRAHNYSREALIEFLRRANIEGGFDGWSFGA